MRRTVSGFALVLAALALVGGSADAVAPRHGDVASRLRPRLQLFPHVAVRGQAVLVSVTSVDVPSLEVNVEGGTSVSGHPLGWRSLHLVDGEWRGAVPLPVRRGVYSLELRVREGGRVMSSSQWLLRVFAHGTQSEAGLPIPARGRGVVGADRASRGVPRRNSALASFGRRPPRPPPTPEARDCVLPTGAPRRRGSTRGIRHRSTCKPDRTVEAARSKRGAVSARCRAGLDANSGACAGVARVEGAYDVPTVSAARRAVVDRCDVSQRHRYADERT